MNGFFIAAAALAALVGLIHSVMGERLIFRRLRKGGLVPSIGGEALRESHIRILWASWHVVTLLGWCIAVLLFRLSYLQSETAFVGGAIIVTMVGSAAVVFLGTRGRHPWWVGLLGVALLTGLGLCT